MSKVAKNPAMVLQELTVKKNLGPPHYEIVHSISGTHENRFDYRVRVANIEALGTGSSKQISKHDAAYKALKELEIVGLYDPQEIPMEEFKASVMQKAAGFPGSPLKTSLNCIGPLKEFCVEQKIEDPVFTELSDVGPSHCREFTYECSIGSCKTVSTANTKKMAKQLAARDMLEKLKLILPEIISEVPRRTEELKTLPPSEKDVKILDLYNKTFSTVITDKKIKVKHFSTVFNNLMNFYEKTKDDFRNAFSERTEEALGNMLGQIGLNYETCMLQEEKPYIVALIIDCDVPFSCMAMADTEELARIEVVDMAFNMLDCYIK